MKPPIAVRMTSLLTAIFFLALIGCTHRLEIKNLSQYRPTVMNPLVKRLSIGIVSTEDNPNVQLLILALSAELQKYSSDVVMPYQLSSDKKVDVIADVRILPEYKGSGANFFINWPGFLVFAPAWHGYNYKVTYNVDVNLVDAVKNEKIDQFSVPIVLDVRHAAINRTWTELSWLEVSIIAFGGGIAFTGYDPKVTPLVVKSAAQTVGAYIGNEIISKINASGRYSFILEKIERDNG